jgi:PAS domain S-box-containing protein
LTVSPYIILPVLAFLVNFFTIAYATALNIRNPVNRSYVMFSSVTSMWVICSAAFHFPVDESVMVPFSKFSSLLWYFTGFFFTNFTYVFLGRRRDLFYYGSLAVTVVSFIIAMSTDLIVPGYTLYPWGWRFTEGILFTPVTLLTIVIPIIVCWSLTLRHQLSTADPARRRQLTPLLAGTMIALVFAAMNQFLFPHIPGLQNIVRYTASWSVLLSIFVFYTIVRHRFLTPGISYVTGELFASSKEGVIIMNSIGTVLHINGAAAAMLGTGVTQPQSIRLEELIRDYSTGQTYSNFRTTTAVAAETRALLLSQSEIHAEGMAIGKILIINDITDMARMNDELRESNELFKLITNNVTDVIWIYDLTAARFSYVSPSVQASTGWTADEFTRLQLSDILGNKDFELITRLLGDEIVNDTSREPGRTRSLVLDEISRNGSIINVEIKTSFIRNAAGKPIAILGVTRDITEHKRLTDELRSSLLQLKERNESIENDLKTAQMVQRALLPAEAPACDRLLIDFRYKPLEAVGGDYFNIQPLAEGGLSVFLSDVTGHGITAALFLSLLKSLSTHHLRKHAHDPSAYLSALNADVYENMQSYFVSAVYGIFKFAPGDQAVRLSAACGGHPQPILHPAGSAHAEYIGVHGKLIGLKKSISYPSLEITLNPGDRVFFYTDGLPEMSDESGLYLNYDRFLEIVRSTRSLDLGRALDAIMFAGSEFRGSSPITDDIVIIGVEVI